MNQPARKSSGWDSSSDSHLASMHYYDRAFQRQAVKILPGEYFTTSHKQDLALVTVLGSCVAACVRDTIAGIGGMNHFMLPDAEGGTSSARYGSYAMELLVNELLKAGAKRDRLEAKVFGGGHVLRHMPTNPVGSRNIKFVRDYLALERIPIVASDLGSDYARKVCYLPASGQAFMRRVDIAKVGEDLASESAYGQFLKTKPVAGDIELFG